MGSSRCTRFQLESLNPVSRVKVDQARSGNQAKDGYAVLDQAKPGSRDEYGFTLPRNRQGLARPVYDGPSYED
jgi:hypothetical protein